MTFIRHILSLALACAVALAASAAEPVDVSEITIDNIDVVGIETEVDTLCTSIELIPQSVIQPPRENLYEHPYSMWRQCPDWKRIWQNTAVLFGAGFATLGILELLPEDATAWNKREIHSTPFFTRWWNHVKAGPVWDSDQALFNYILHPYAGAAYYMAARSQGLNLLGSFAYATFISSIFWEYGIESFNEVPSIQDLILTPIAGMVMGELFYIAKRSIVNNGYRLLGSAVLGNIVAVIIDPANEILGFIFGNSARRLVKYRGQQARSLQSPADWPGCNPTDATVNNPTDNQGRRSASAPECRSASAPECRSAWGPVTAGGSTAFGLSLSLTF